MDKLYDRLGLPTSYYRRHQAILDGLPLTLIARLARELSVPPSQVTEWLHAEARGRDMPVTTGEAFCRLVGIVDALLKLHDGNYPEAIRWLTSPHVALASDRPINLLTTEAGGQAVLQLAHAIEYGLPV